MSWEILHDLDNLLRTGDAVISSAPTREFGSSLDALTDGVQAIPCRFLGVQDREIVITFPGGLTGVGMVSIHDLRVDGEDYTGVTITGLTEPVTFTREEIEKSLGSVAWSGHASVSELLIRIDPVGSNSAWSLAEICLGSPWGAVSISEAGDSPARRLEFSRTWNTVANGPWRTKLAEPVQTYVLSLAAGFERDALEEYLRRSDGGARPVVFKPDRSQPKAIHGHLGDEFSGAIGLGGVWEEGAQLVFTEGMRALK